ncbi:MAG: ABC transporter permease [Erysipelotrichaceae bacterium]
MRELVLFSLKRRIWNKTMGLWNLLLCLVCGVVLFSDVILETLTPDWLAPYQVVIEDDSVRNFMEQLEMEQIEFVKVAEQGVLKVAMFYPAEFRLVFQYEPKHDVEQAVSVGYHQYLQRWIAQEQGLSIEQLDRLLYPSAINVEVLEPIQEQQNPVLLFLLLTAIYFLMLSFSTSIANEIIYEKATKTLELILTSIPARTHLLGKLIVSWTTICLQMLMALAWFLFWAWLRYDYDLGVGLLRLVANLTQFPVASLTFIDVIKMIQPSLQQGTLLLLALAVLCIGMITIQLCLVVASSFLGTLEEASAIQAPFYLVLLGIYYTCLACNSPYQLTYGLGYGLSFVPLFSMLLMPARLLLGNVPIVELLFCLTIQLGVLFFVYKKGMALYQIGVLDYANQGIRYAMQQVKRKPRY